VLFAPAAGRSWRLIFSLKDRKSLMLNVRKTWIVVLALALVAVCSAPLSAAPLLGTKGAGDDADKWLLNDPEAVITINIKQMLSSDIFKAGMPMIKDSLNKNEEAKALLQTIGLDPFKDIDSVLISSSGGSAKDVKALIVIKGRFDTDKIHTALAKEAEKKDKVELVKEGGQQLYLIKQQEQTICAGFANKSTLVATLNKEATLDAIKNGGTKPAKIGKEMKNALGKFTGKEGVTFAMVVTDEMKKMIDRAPPQAKPAAKLQTLTASLSVTDTVEVNITGHASEQAAAKQLSNSLGLVKVAASNLIEDLPPIVSKVLEAIKISNEKESVVVALKLTKEMMDEIRKLTGDK
jgi:hypothetical protein